MTSHRGCLTIPLIIFLQPFKAACRFLELLGLLFPSSLLCHTLWLYVSSCAPAQFVLYLSPSQTTSQGSTMQAQLSPKQRVHLKNLGSLGNVQTKQTAKALNDDSLHASCHFQHFGTCFLLASIIVEAKGDFLHILNISELKSGRRDCGREEKVLNRTLIFFVL